MGLNDLFSAVVRPEALIAKTVVKKFTDRNPDISQTSSDSFAKSTRSVEELNQRMDKLIITCQAMWEIIKENSNMQEEDIVAKINEIDKRDGVEDGKITLKIAKCVSCGRTLSRKHNKCLYCGSSPKLTNLFSTI